MTLEECRDQVAKLAAQGLKPKTIVLCPADAAKLPKGATQLYGLNVVVAHNFDKSIVSPGYYEKMVVEPNHKKIIER